MRARSVGSRLGSWGVAFALTMALVGCGGATQEPQWPKAATEWYARAELGFKEGDLDDADNAADKALASLPNEPKIRVLAARIALAQLEFDRVIQLTKGLPGAQAAGLRGRAHWYAGRIEEAADELDALLADPSVRDPWAEQVSKLARRGRGRRPFEMSGGLLAVLDMPRVGNTSMLVPVEVNGEPSLAMIATDTAEAVIDSSSGGDGTWVSLRFGERVEVADVPAVGRDLSGLSRQLNAPIKMLIGVNLLRHLRATVDFAAGQFVVRSFEPPPPPQATTVHPGYFRGGALVLPVYYGVEPTAPRGSLFLHTTMTHPIALDEAGWKKGGVGPGDFSAVPGEASIKTAILPMLRVGAYEVPRVPGILGAPVGEMEEVLGIDLDGYAGSSFLATFRVTFADDGRTMWLEGLPPEMFGPPRVAPAPAPDREDEVPSATSPAPAAAPAGAAAPPSAPPKAPPATPAPKPPAPGTNPRP